MSSRRAVHCVSKCVHTYVRMYTLGHTSWTRRTRCVQLFITYSQLLYAVVVDAVLVVAMCIRVTDCRCVQSWNSTYMSVRFALATPLSDTFLAERSSQVPHKKDNCNLTLLCLTASKSVLNTKLSQKSDLNCVHENKL